ncbi:hypothetical protein T4D_6462 [Trichinella pseudospiralis]|uniref:Uncharacterized protein n=1 Tax=Trichinella pseudospiralis TaxID=6337 RepID=A0A0V1F6U8_TRIPS|nr:hypothetical protein T4D_6462 [Trichinella pseudospiralis]
MRKKNKATVGRPVLEDQEGQLDGRIGGFGDIRWLLLLWLLNKLYTQCCCFVVAMASLKREAERKGKSGGQYRTVDK